MMSDNLRVVIVDDHPLFREGVAHTLRAAPGIEIVGEGGAADEAIHLARDLHPDVILLDIGIPGGGLNAARTIAEDACATKNRHVYGFRR
jgi:two-component system nitrate/nitrite response regulator NarL